MLFSLSFKDVIFLSLASVERAHVMPLSASALFPPMWKFGNFPPFFTIIFIANRINATVIKPRVKRIVYNIFTIFVDANIMINSD